MKQRPQNLTFFTQQPERVTVSSKHALCTGKAGQTGQRGEGEDFFHLIYVKPFVITILSSPASFSTSYF